MQGTRAVGDRVLEILAGIDPENPNVDEEAAAERLQAYVEALGLPAPRVRFAPDVRALRLARVWPAPDRGAWQSFAQRQRWLLEPDRRGRWTRGWQVPETSDAVAPSLQALSRADRTVLGVGLGSSRDVRGVRWLTPSLEMLARELTGNEPSEAPKRLAALVPLAEAAAAGIFAYAVGRRGAGDLVALARPRLRFDADGRLHDWDGNPAAEWTNGRGLYFWHGVEMTESAGRDPEAVTPRRILRWHNAERRRVAIERIGIERFMKAVGAEVVQQDDYGKLWRTKREVDGEPFVAVEVVNATREPDGTYRHYFLRVPPNTRTARAAVAWTFGFTKATAYETSVQT